MDNNLSLKKLKSFKEVNHKGFNNCYEQTNQALKWIREYYTEDIKDHFTNLNGEKINEITKRRMDIERGSANKKPKLKIAAAEYSVDEFFKE